MNKIATLLMVDKMTKNNEAVSNPTAQEQEGAAFTQEDGAVEDYTFVHHKARIACYDDPLSEPRIIEVPPAPTREFLTNLAQTIWQQVRMWDSPIPYAVITDVSENFIHAQFNEMVVSIFDHGNTIRFSDQGPGIPHKELVQEWGFSTATEPMKEYIHGVGSGLPRVKEFLACKNGTISIQDNLGSGAVVTISFNKTDTVDDKEFEDDEDLDIASDYYAQEPQQSYQESHYQPALTSYPYTPPQPEVVYTQQPPYAYPQPYNQGYTTPYQQVIQQPYYNNGVPTVIQNVPQGIPVSSGYYPTQVPPAVQPVTHAYQPQAVDLRGIVKDLTKRDREVLLCFEPGEYLRNIEIENMCELPASTVNNALKRIEGLKLVKKMPNKSRVLTELGVSILTFLKQNNPYL